MIIPCCRCDNSRLAAFPRNVKVEVPYQQPRSISAWKVQAAVTTLLFTDIEGSTRLWEQEAANMSPALAQHDALSRMAVERNRGIVVKMTGDGMYAAFDDAMDALNASLMLQQSLNDPAATNGITFRVRYGLHLGAVERRNDDLFGSPVNRAARGDEGGAWRPDTALSGGRRRSSVPGFRRTWRYSISGAVRLRDLARPASTSTSLPTRSFAATFPALRSLEATPNNLPQQVTSFIGRERELTDIKQLLEGTRLLTLLGMGGLGKTRLSLQIAADVLEKYPDGVWFVELAPIKDPSLVPECARPGARRSRGAGQAAGADTLRARQGSQASVRDRQLRAPRGCVRQSRRRTAARSAADAHPRDPAARGLKIRGEQVYHVLPLKAPTATPASRACCAPRRCNCSSSAARLQKPSFH